MLAVCTPVVCNFLQWIQIQNINMSLKAVIEQWFVLMLRPPAEVKVYYTLLG